MTAPEPPEGAEPPEGTQAAQPGGPRDPAAPGPPGESVLSEQSREDTDADWGEYPESERDRLYRDRPPHWDDY